TIDEIKAQQQDLQNQTDTLQSELDALKGDEAKAAQYKETLEEKISLTEKRIDSARESIKTLNANITALETKLDQSQGEYDATMEQLQKRIKALYQTGDVGTVEILLNATSLYDFSLKTETLKSVTEHDKNLMDKIHNYMVATKADRDSLQAQKDEVASLKKQLEGDQNDLKKLNDENNLIIEDLRSKQATKQTKIAELAQEDEALNAQLTELIAQKKKEEEERKKQEEEERKQQEESDKGGGESTDAGDKPSGGGDGEGMSDGFSPRWPVPGYDTSWITCWYGNGHNGLDIAAGYGAPIVAAQAGQVISSEFHYSWGNNVLIYHNGTYSTRYAHMSSMAVSAGDYVERGQIIGYVGSTGNSTGNHLHFEVYLDGYRVDPYQYL
ncbi:MAG: peptidoglycan DD-metalloendopeptidase family protein, partial [Oscillospiraceae bacterium]